MDLPHPFRRSPQLLPPGLGRWLRQLGGWALVACLVVHGLALSAQRAGGRLHIHTSAPLAGGLAHGHGLAHSHPDDDDDVHGHAHGHAHDQRHDHDHAHRAAADHGHAPDDRSVIPVVMGDHGASPSPSASPPGVYQLDGLLTRVAAAGDDGARERWPRQGAPEIRSFIPSLPERPPSV